MPHSLFASRTRATVWMAAIAAICIGVPLWQLLAYEPYGIALGLPQTWQGGIEAIVVVLLLVLAQAIRKPAARAIAMVVVSELYLRRHGADIAAAIDLLYFEILIALGVVATRLCGARKPVDSSEYLRCFILGVALWSAGAWMLSACGLGSLKALRIFTAAIALLSLIGRPAAMSAFVFRRTRSMPFATRTCIAIFFAWMLILFAKTSVAIGFDSLWYGLRGDLVLVGEGSAFTSQGLISAVHYFPKLFELMLIPVSGLGSSGVISGMSIFVWAMLAVACSEALKRLGVGTLSMRLMITLACVTLPLISNPAIDPKPELLAGLFIVAAWIYASDFIALRRIEAMLWSIACAILATQAKLVAIPFIAAILIVAGGLALRRKQPFASSDPTRDRIAWIVVSCAVVVGIFVTARTLLLAGVPTIGPDALFHLWQAMGFDLKFPAGTLTWTKPQNWSDVPLLAFQLLFQPQLLEHIITHWVGNIWFWAACAIPFLPTSRKRDDPQHHPTAAIGLACALCGALLMFGVSYGVRGGDGNYFIAAVAPATLIGLATLSLRCVGAQRTVFVAALAAFSLFHACFAFVSVDWMSGTRALDWNFSNGLHTYRKRNRQLLMNAGIYEIDRVLRHVHPTPRVVGCLDDDLDMRLSARTESVQQIAYSRRDFYVSDDAFLNFLRDDKIAFLIMPQPGNAAATCLDVAAVRNAAHGFAQDPSVRVINDREYVMYDLSHWSRR